MVDKRQKKKHHRRSSSRSESRSKSRSKRIKDRKRKRSHTRSRSSERYRNKTKSRSNDRKKEKNSKHHFEEHSGKKNTEETKAYKPQMEESNCLIIQNIDESITQENLDQVLRDLAFECQTSMPDEIRMISALGTAYAVFPSKEAAKKILYKLEGILQILNLNLSIDFYPANLAKNKQHSSAKQDVNLVQDWICDRCDYKNFARRTKCYKCENPRNQNCRVVYNSACIIRPNAGGGLVHQQPSMTAIDTGAGANTSLMVRGNILFEINETMLLDIFSRLAPVKDIRMVKNKNTGQMRDFAFIEFYTIEEAESVLKITQDPDFRVSGQNVTVAFSKSRKRDEEYAGNAFGNQAFLGAATNPNYVYDESTGSYYYQPNNNNQNFGNYDYYSNANEQNFNPYYNQINFGVGYEGQSQYSHPQNFIDQNEIHSLTQPSSNLFLSTSIQPGHIPLKNAENQNILENDQHKNQSALQLTQSKVSNPDKNNSDKRKDKLPKNSTPPADSKKPLDEKARRKQIEIEMKKWEKEQQKNSTTQVTQSSIQVEIKTAELSTDGKKSPQITFQKEKPAESNINIISTNKDKKIVFTEAFLEPKKESEKTSKIVMFVCLLCKRKFENEEKLRLHERLSEMHKENVMKMNEEKKVK